MRTPKPKQRPRKSQAGSFPVPTAGLISNRNLAMPTDGSAPGAELLENFFPTPSGCILRRGMIRHATIESFATVRRLMPYVDGNNERLFAATDEGIYDVTNPREAEPFALFAAPETAIAAGEAAALGVVSIPDASALHRATDGLWSYVQFATAGGTFLIGVNGVDDPFIYNGSEFLPYVAGGVFSINLSDATGISAGSVISGPAVNGVTPTATVVKLSGATAFMRDKTGEFVAGSRVTTPSGGSATVVASNGLAAPGLSGVDGKSVAYVWTYQQRLFFIERDTLNAYYLPVDQAGGDAVLLPLGGVFPSGGSLLFGSSWSLDSGGDGGLSDQCIFATTEGEVASFQGKNPDSADGWSKVGIYRVGEPLGRFAHMRAGGDIVIATTLGFVPLGKAISLDYAALGSAAISNPIADDWRRAVEDRGNTGWNCLLWGERSMTLVVVPATAGSPTINLVANSDNGAWCKFTGWEPTCMAVHRGMLFLGSTDGKVQRAWTTGQDEGNPYTGACIPLFSDCGQPAQRKYLEIGRAVVRSQLPLSERIHGRADWNVKLPAAPDARQTSSSYLWDDEAIWDNAVWDSQVPTVISERWRPVGGTGYAISLSVQITSGSVSPLDAELIRLDVTYHTADIVS